MVDGKPILLSEVDAQLKGDLLRLKLDHEHQIFELRRQVISRLVMSRLLGEKVTEPGQDPPQFLDTLVESRVPAATVAEAREYYDKTKALSDGAPFEQVRERLTTYLTKQRRAEAAQRFMEDLRSKATVEVTLAEPELLPIEVAATGPQKGPDSAVVTIVEFADFQCQYCSRAQESIDKVLSTYGDKVRLVYRDFPLPFHDKAVKAAEAGHCAHAQGKFWKMHDHLLANQGKLAVDELKKAARTVGLDGAAFDACLDSGQFSAAVQANIKAGSAAGVKSTPHFFINGRQIEGAQPFSAFKTVIDRLLPSVEQ